jgi:hypothetical protein
MQKDFKDLYIKQLEEQVVGLESLLLLYEPFGSINASDSCTITFPTNFEEIKKEIHKFLIENE